MSHTAIALGCLSHCSPPCVCHISVSSRGDARSNLKAPIQGFQALEAQVAQDPGLTAVAETEPHEAPRVVEQRTLTDEQRIGRNDPCWCGSGLKYKKCHGAAA